MRLFDSVAENREIKIPVKIGIILTAHVSPECAAAAAGPYQVSQFGVKYPS